VHELGVQYPFSWIAAVLRIVLLDHYQGPRRDQFSILARIAEFLSSRETYEVERDEVVVWDIVCEISRVPQSPFKHISQKRTCSRCISILMQLHT